MSTCATCGKELEEGSRFCGECGAAAPARAEEPALPAPAEERSTPTAPPPPYHGTRIELDKEMVNSLLALYSGLPEGCEPKLRDGRLQMSLGEHQLEVNPLRLSEAARLHWRTESMGPLEVSIDLVELHKAGLEVRMRLL